MIRQEFKPKSGLKSELCGLQITPSGVAIAHIVWENGTPVLACCDMLPGALSPELFIPGISFFVKKNKLEDIRCSWILSPSDYILMPVGNLPVVSDEIDSAVRWHVKDRINYPIDEASINHFALPNLGQVSKEDFIYAIVAKKKFLEMTSSMIMQTGLKLDIIDIPEFALRNFAILNSAVLENSHQGIGLIEVHPSRASLLVMEKGQIKFLRQIEWNKKNGLETVAAEIHRSLYYYENELGQSPVQKFYISPSYQTFFPELKQSLPFETQDLDFNQLKDIRCFTALGGALREENIHAAAN